MNGCNRLIHLALLVAVACAAGGAAPTTQPRELIAGADISMLPEIERAGGVFRHTGTSSDAILILKDNGCNLFRVRLFVQPSTDFNKSFGATQDLPYVRALAKRIKASGAGFLLDIHYSDTWADGSHQTRPGSWIDSDFDSLEKHVHDYTASVLRDLQDNGGTPDLVQIGNEIAGGMLWPDGKVLDAPPESEQRQWERFARLANAGAKAVRASQRDGHVTRIMIHIHGGGRAGLPQWFFEKFNRNPVDYDVIGLSFYPAWTDSIDALKQNMSDLANTWHKDIVIAEASYPWKEMEGITDTSVMRWPLTPAGQKQFIADLWKCLDEVPDGKGKGFIWWYPEAIPVPGRFIWRTGAEALFDQKGETLPALSAFHHAGN